MLNYYFICLIICLFVLFVFTYVLFGVSCVLRYFIWFIPGLTLFNLVGGTSENSEWWGEVVIIWYPNTHPHIFFITYCIF